MPFPGFEILAPALAPFATFSQPGDSYLVDPCTPVYMGQIDNRNTGAGG